MVPRLWPFLYHSSGSVRGSALKTLDTLTACASPVEVPSNIVSLTNVSKDGCEKQTSQEEKSEPNINEGMNFKTENSPERHTVTGSSETEVDVVTIKSECNETEKQENMVLPEIKKENELSCVNKTGGRKDGELAVTNNGENGIKSPVTKKKVDANIEAVVNDFKKVSTESAVIKNNQVTSVIKGLVASKTEEKITENSVSTFHLKDVIDDRTLQKDMDVESLKVAETSCNWLSTIIQPALTHIYQRALLERSAENLDLVFKVGKSLFGCIRKLECIFHFMINIWMFVFPDIK